jgi:hypothetical protein
MKKYFKQGLDLIEVDNSAKASTRIQITEFTCVAVKITAESLFAQVTGVLPEEENSSAEEFSEVMSQVISRITG